MTSADNQPSPHSFAADVSIPGSQPRRNRVLEMVGKRSQQGSVSIDAALPTNPLDQKLSDVAVRSPTDSDPPPADTSSNPLTHDKEPPFRFLLTWRFWCILVLGQILSWCIVSTNTFTEYLALDGANIPAFQSLFNYALLNVIYTGWTMYKYGSKKWAVLVWKDGWKYFVLGFADVQGVRRSFLDC